MLVIALQNVLGLRRQWDTNSKIKGGGIAMKELVKTSLTKFTKIFCSHRISGKDDVN